MNVGPGNIYMFKMLLLSFCNYYDLENNLLNPYDTGSLCVKFKFFMVFGL